MSAGRRAPTMGRQAQQAPRQQSTSTGARSRPRGWRACPAYMPRTGTCAAVRSPGLGPIVSRFCLDQDLSRYKSPNSASYHPLRGHTHGISNISALRTPRRRCARSSQAPEATGGEHALVEAYSFPRSKLAPSYLKARQRTLRCQVFPLDGE